MTYASKDLIHAGFTTFFSAVITTTANLAKGYLFLLESLVESRKGNIFMWN